MQEQSTKLKFEDQNIYVGIDTHKKKWKVALYHEDISLKTFTQDPKPGQLVGYLEKNYPGATFHVAYEAGFCGFWIQKSLSALGVNCVVVNPADVPTSHKEKEFKTDPRDCRKIAKALRSNLLDPIYIPSDEGLESRHLVRLYHDVAKSYTRCKNKVKAKLNFYGIEYPQEFSTVYNHWSNKFYNWLKNVELKSEEGNWALQFYIDECLKAKALKNTVTKKVRALAKLEKYSRGIAFLRSVPGIGLINSMTILLEIQDIKRFKNLDKLSSYIGIVPSSNSSGEKERVGNMTKRGNKYLKNAIIESSWIAIRHDPVLLHKFISLKNRMDGNKAIIRVARKLIARILYVLVNEKKYEIGKKI